MQEHKEQKTRLALAGRGISLAEVGRRCDPPVSRQYVSQVVRGDRVGRRVRRVIRQTLGWDPWANEGKESAA